MIETKALIEIAGYPKEHIKDTMDLVIERLKTDKDIFVKNVRVSDENQIKEIWSIFAEFDLEFENINTFLSFCFDYTPSSVEITRPEKLNINSIEFTGLINDLLETLHRYHVIIANMDAENKALKLNMAKGQELHQEPKEKLKKQIKSKK